jgi:hypothetical protein
MVVASPILQVYGENMPVIELLVVSGRAKMHI